MKAGAADGAVNGLRYLYYPGCSGHASARDYARSTYAVFRALGVEISELPEWCCCGSTVMPGIDPTGAMALCARNLAIAEPTGLDIAVSCSACFCALRSTLEAFLSEERVRERLRRVLAVVGRDLEGKVRVKHALHILTHDLGLPRLQSHVRRPLDYLKVVAYYGCLLSRPRNPYENPENPTSLDELLRAVGADVLPFEHRTACCGGSLMYTKGDAALRLCFDILREASDRGADLVVVACPMCHLNLDAFRHRILARHGSCPQIPVAYFTQVVGAALGLSGKALGVHESFLRAAHVLTVS